MSYVIYVVDTETTGTNPEKHDVIEVSFFRLSDNQQKTWYIKPINPETIETKALYINKHNLDDILHKTAHGKETYLDPVNVIEDIENWIMDDDATINERAFVGQNPQFDFDFLKALWKKTGNENTFPFRDFIIDTIMITRIIDICTGKQRDRYNLMSLVNAFGISKSKAHRASEDTKMTKELFNKQIEPIKDILAKEFENCYLE